MIIVMTAHKRSRMTPVGPEHGCYSSKRSRLSCNFRAMSQAYDTAATPANQSGVTQAG